MELAKIPAFEQVNLISAGVKLTNQEPDQDFGLVFDDMMQQFDEDDKDLIDFMLLQGFAQMPLQSPEESLPPDLHTIAANGAVVIPDTPVKQAETVKEEDFTAEHKLVVIKSNGFAGILDFISVQPDSAEKEISEILDSGQTQMSQEVTADEEKDIFTAVFDSKLGKNEPVERETDLENINRETEPEYIGNKKMQYADFAEDPLQTEVTQKENSIDGKKIYLPETEPQEDVVKNFESVEDPDNTHNIASSKAQKTLTDFFRTENSKETIDGDRHDFAKALKTQETAEIRPALHMNSGVDAATSPQIERAKPILAQELIDKIVERIEYSASMGIKELKVELKPDFLGKLDIKLLQDKDGIKAKIKVDNPHVENILKTEMSRLIENLKDKNIEIVNIDIFENPQHGDASERGFNNFEQSHDRGRNTAIKGGIREKTTETNPQPTPSIISKVKIDCFV